MKLPYLQLKTVSQCTEPLMQTKDDSKFIKVYGDNYVYPLNASILMKDAAIYELMQRFDIELSKKMTIFRLYPNTVYNWHTDGIRSCAINMQLTAFGDSLTMFGIPDENNLLYSDVTRLDYQPHRYYLFNTGVAHTIYNFSQTRYLLSLGVPKKFSHEEVEEYIIQHDI